MYTNIQIFRKALKFYAKHGFKIISDELALTSTDRPKEYYRFYMEKVL